MKWTVIGADRESGADIKLVVEAASKEEAMRRANAGGVLVARVLAGVKDPPATIHDSGRQAVTQAKPSVASDARPKRLPCPSCAEPVLPSAYICPHCKRTIVRDPRVIGFALVVALIVGVVIWFAFDAMVDHESKRIMTDTREQTRQLMKDVQADTDQAMKDARREADAAMRKAAGQ